MAILRVFGVTGTIFIEFWATWCAPCIALIPDLKQLYQHAAPNGLVWISIDSDEDPDAATAYLEKNEFMAQLPRQK